MQPNDIWDHIEMVGSNECWPWTMGIHHSGYGVVNLPNKKFGRTIWRQFRIHRLVWELTFGEIPEGLCVLHKCDNPPCCNPDHLFIGTYKDNTQDMIRKGRGKGGHKPGQFVGEKATAAKLTNKEVLEIKRLLNKSGLTHSEIALEFDCNRVTITRINLGIVWNSVKLEDSDGG